MISRYWTCLILALVVGGGARAQNREAYRIDFSKLTSSADDSAEHMERLKASLRVLKGKLSQSADNVLSALEARDEILAILDRKHFIAHLHYLLDTTFPKNDDSDDPDVEAYGGFIDPEISALSDAQIARFRSEKPELNQYAYVIEEARRDKAHRLSDREEATLSKLHPDYEEWEGRAFETLRSDLPTGKVSHTLHATALVELCTSLNAEAKLRGFADDVDAYCFDLHLETPKVDGLLASLRRNGKLLEDLDTVRSKNRSVDAAPAPKFGLEEATQDVVRALAPLGPEYGAEMTALLDPKNGRIDVAGGPNRSGLGTGWSAPGLPSILYWPNFTGVYDDLDRGLSHEGGHAIHYALMIKAGIPDESFAGPGYLYESFAELNQLLLADYLYKKETDPARKLFFLNRFLEKADYPLYLARFPELEFAIHRGVSSGKIRSAEDLDKLEESILSHWAGPRRTPDNRLWMTNETFYTHPIYNINHLLGSILAIAYFVQLEKDPANFVPRYMDLLRHGFHESPQALLKDSLGIDLGDPALVTQSMEFLRGRIAELGKLYKSNHVVSNRGR